MVAALRTDLPHVADEVVAEVVAGVPSYRDALSGAMGATIRQAVEIALNGFLVVASRGGGSATPRAPALDGAHQLGRGEAREGRTPEALLAAYRIGARSAWRHMSASALAAGIGPQELAEFAELVFLYIDELSDASAAGHADELASAGRAHQRLLEQLARHLIRGAPAEVIDDAATRAGWDRPTTLTGVLCPTPQLRSLLPLVPARTLVLEDLTDVLRTPDPALDDTAVLLVPDVHGPARGALRQSARGRGTTIGPARPWREVHASYDRAVRAAHVGLHGDTDDHLVPLVLSADPDAHADLRAAALAPLADLRPAAAAKLEETLRSWLLHQGRREAVATDLFIHPQTVRYRVGQLREVFGDALEQPEAVLALTVALGLPVRTDTRTSDGGETPR